MIVASLLLLSVASVLSQNTPPPFLKLGCPKPKTWPFEGDGKYCFVGGTSCIRDREFILHQTGRVPPDAEVAKNNNVYRVIRARSWWFCGKACDPTTPCKFWTYRHGMRRCYLLKSCCEQERQGFTSGTNKCPGYD
jgi:hypothetical protein